MIDIAQLPIYTLATPSEILQREGDLSHVYCIASYDSIIMAAELAKA